MCSIFPSPLKFSASSGTVLNEDKSALLMGTIRPESIFVTGYLFQQNHKILYKIEDDGRLIINPLGGIVVKLNYNGAGTDTDTDSETQGNDDTDIPEKTDECS